MVKAFITKFPASVNNDALQVLGMVHIPFHKQSVPNVNDRSIFVTFNDNVTAKIAGDGYFTDDSLSTNKGKTLDIPASTLTKITVSNDDGYLQFDKYKITELRTDNGDWRPVCTLRAFDLDLSQLKYSSSISMLYLSNTNVTGDISALSNMTNISTLSLNNTNVTGDISVLSNMTNISSLYLDNTNVTGDISALSNMTNISSLYLSNTNVTGDISALSNMTNISMLYLSNTNVTGSMSSLSKLTRLKTLSIVNNSISGVYDDFAPFTNLNSVNGYGTNVKINSGTLSKLPKSLQCIILPDVSSCTWNKGERTNGYIFGSNTVFPLSNVDDFLIDMAKCQKNNDSGPYSHTINLRGTRTSASDSALAKLQELGYTVTIYS